MIMFEDNTATIQIIKTGKNPTMRHLLRHQGINIRFLHETFYPRDPITCEPLESQCHMQYIVSALRRADIFTKAVEKAKFTRVRDFMMNVHSTLRVPLESGLVTAVGASHRMMCSLIRRL